MSPAQMVTWGDLAQKFTTAIGVPLIVATLGYGASELGSLKREVQDLRVEVAMLKVELKMHREQERN